VIQTRKVRVDLAALLLFEFSRRFSEGTLSFSFVLFKISVYHVFIVVSIHPHGTADNGQMSCLSFTPWLARKGIGPDYGGMRSDDTSFRDGLYAAVKG
jgi:hypothetical protein